LSDGAPWRPLIHVQDMARAIEWAIGRNRDAGGDYLVVNTGSDEWNYQVKDLAVATAGPIAGTEVHVNPAGQPDRRSYRVDLSVFRSLAPEHQPQVDLPGAVADLKSGLQRMRFAIVDFGTHPSCD
jgi:nucleoside-diphosphate-sugar epimerase